MTRSLPGDAAIPCTPEQGRVECGVRRVCFEVPGVPAEVRMSRFRGALGTSECAISVRPTEHADFATQLAWVERAYAGARSTLGLGGTTCLTRRFFCSDLGNQGAVLAGHTMSDPADETDPCAVTWLRMAPLAPARVAMLAYHVADEFGPIVRTRVGRTLVWRRAELAHHWTVGLTCPNASGSHDQTLGVFLGLEEDLAAHQMTIDGNVVRTWLYVRDIGLNYAGVVNARRELFRRRGLTSETHFIASTGIEGGGIDPASTVLMDAYAIRGLRTEQVRYLAAPDHMGPTHLYGVTFERGVEVAYRDRRQLIISGTASIDPEGRIVHPGDVRRQFGRAMENVEALLERAGATPADLQHLVVYVRDPADLGVVASMVRDQAGDLPHVVVIAPVCRPGWLVEVEGAAVVTGFEPDLPAF